MPPLPLRTHPKTEDESPRRWRRWKWLLLLLIPLIVWQVWRVVSSGRQLAKARELQAQMADPNLPPEKRQQLFQDLRSSMANLTSEQRGILFADQQKRQEQELDRYFAMSKAEQKRYLDDRINRMQQAKNSQNGSRPSSQTKGTTTASLGPGSGKGPGGPSGKSSNPDDIEKRKKQMLERSTPDFRAKNDRFRKELDQRMKDRGIAPPQGRGR